MKRLLYSWFGFLFVIVASFFSCGVLILLLSKTDSSFSKWISTNHLTPLLFTDINSDSPNGLSKEEFLAEVRYLGNLKENVDLLEEGILLKIIAAFKAHPWVEKVSAMQREGTNNLQVNLVFRKPCLIVPMLQANDQARVNENYRVVDRNSIILPKNAIRIGLLTYYKAIPFPKGNAGTPWGNDEVLACAKVAGNVVDAISLPKDCVIELKDDLIQLYADNNNFRVLWGRVFQGNSTLLLETDKRKEILIEKYGNWVTAGMKNEFLLDLSMLVPH